MTMNGQGHSKHKHPLIYHLKTVLTATERTHKINSHVKESLDSNHRRDYSVLCHNLRQLHQSTVASL